MNKNSKIIADGRMPIEVKMELEKMGTVFWLEDTKKAYPAISCHPDIFFCKIDNQLISAKNAPENIIKSLIKCDVNISMGSLDVGIKYPETARYNAVITNEYIIRNTKIENPDFEKFYKNRELIHVSQGYTRCNLIHLKNKYFLTSDRDIERRLTKKGLQVLWVNPEEIILPTMKYGFIGGCCGVWKNTLFLTGSLKYHSQGAEIRDFVFSSGMNIKELYQGRLWDGGGIFEIND